MSSRLAGPASQPTIVAEERHVVRRGITAVALLSIALIHLLDLQGKLDELPYVGVLFIGLIIVSLVLAEALIRTDDVRVWLMAGAVSAATMIGYAISRSTGLPGDDGEDIGNWLEAKASPRCWSRVSSACSSWDGSRIAAEQSAGEAIAVDQAKSARRLGRLSTGQPVLA